ncbi:MAG: hypothetical protein KAS58_03050 [Calditrichia bacterium]|nr:hypothetical protein [Calditrichia bacterium]
MKQLVFSLIIIFGLVFISINDMAACTTAIITGKATPDGRPLLLKHRDSDYYQNKLMYFNDGKYSYIGLVNSEDLEGKEVWSGANSAGFAIMNAASYNLNDNDTTKLKDQEGIIMKEALRSCATLGDFENLLKEWIRPLGVESNFGVIDAQGGAAYYETTNFSFTKIDATDPSTAPHGYIIRTNYSSTGTADGGYGYIRYSTAEHLFKKAREQNELTHKFLLQKVSRSLKHSLLDIDLMEFPHSSEEKEHFVNFQDYIPRHSSVTTMVVQGVKEGENAEFTTIWTILGFPLCSVVVPTWVVGGSELPKVLISDESGNAPLCQMALELKNRCFPISRGSGWKYINLTALLTDQGGRILQKLLPVENSIIDLTEKNLFKWRESGIEKNNIHNLYHQLSELILTEYKNMFEL